MTKRGIITILALFLAVSAWTQGLPVRNMSVTAKKGIKFKVIPKPGEELILTKLIPRSNTVLRGNVTVLFKDASAGKFRGGLITVLMLNKTVTSVSLDAPNEKVKKRLVKQLYKQYGAPYKLEVKKGHHLITWNRKSDLIIHYDEDLQAKNTSCLVERR